MESILDSVKKILGIGEEYNYFDADLILHINSVFTILSQLGVGDGTPFAITGSDERWNDYLPEGEDLSFIKSYMAEKVRLLFDPPLSSAVMTAKNNIVSELEWRINVNADREESEETI